MRCIKSLVVDLFWWLHRHHFIRLVILGLLLKPYVLLRDCKRLRCRLNLVPYLLRFINFYFFHLDLLLKYLGIFSLLLYLFSSFALIIASTKHILRFLHLQLLHFELSVRACCRLGTHWLCR